VKCFSFTKFDWLIDWLIIKAHVGLWDQRFFTTSSLLCYQTVFLLVRHEVDHYIASLSFVFDAANVSEQTIKFIFVKTISEISFLYCAVSICVHRLKVTCGRQQKVLRDGRRCDWQMSQFVRYAGTDYGWHVTTVVNWRTSSPWSLLSSAVCGRTRCWWSGDSSRSLVAACWVMTHVWL